jgi:hypothetical protein
VRVKLVLPELFPGDARAGHLDAIAKDRPGEGPSGG